MNEEDILKVKELLKDPVYQRIFANLIKELALKFPIEVRESFIRNILIEAKYILENGR